MAMKKSRNSLTSGQLARSAGVSPDTIRHYEQLGLIMKPPRSAGGYRLYDDGALHRVQVVRSALKVGFTLAELSIIFKERNRGGAPCRKVAELATEKIAQLDQQLSELAFLRNTLSDITASWSERVKNLRPGERAGLLQSLPDSQPIRNES